MDRVQKLSGWLFNGQAVLVLKKQFHVGHHTRGEIGLLANIIQHLQPDCTASVEHDLCDKQEAQDVSFPRSLRGQELKGTCLGLNRGISLSVAKIECQLRWKEWNLQQGKGSWTFFK
ncbi:uncharacterized protein LOC110769216 [Prunus avium]|uniref:Uncharacterized protein LOC110769216 n=1 Tax=Prunus avium TaxID=42229 RepID=A0A6P5TP56_PRUAV|nr:uncharacterized protein LOC110769216 [Prunus avium]